jgi:hypothetical protein
MTDCRTSVNHSDSWRSVPGHCMCWPGGAPSGSATSSVSKNGARAARTACSTRRVGQMDRSTEGGNDPARLQQRSHARPPARWVRPMQRRRRIDQAIGLIEPQIFEPGPHDLDGCRHVLTQLGEHGGVRLGRGDHHPALHEQTGCFAGSRRQSRVRFESAYARRSSPCRKLRGVRRSEPFVCSRHRSEAQRATRHAAILARSAPQTCRVG